MDENEIDPESITARVVGFEPMRPDRRLGFRNRTLTGEDFSGRDLDGFYAIDSTFDACRFDSLRLKYCANFGAGKRQSVYRDCSFDGAKLCMGIGGFYRFERCSFRDVDRWECPKAFYGFGGLKKDELDAYFDLIRRHI